MYNRYIKLVHGSQSASDLELLRIINSTNFYARTLWFFFLYYDHSTVNFLHQSSVKKACF